GVVHDVFPADGVSRGFIGMNGVASDGAGGLHSAGSARIFHQDSAGAISTVIAGAPAGYSGDDGPASQAQVRSIMGLARDGAGDLFFADSGNNALRYVTPAGIIHTLTAALAQPVGVLVLPDGHVVTE